LYELVVVKWDSSRKAFRAQKKPDEITGLKDYVD